MKNNKLYSDSYLVLKSKSVDALLGRWKWQSIAFKTSTSKEQHEFCHVMCTMGNIAQNTTSRITSWSSNDKSRIKTVSEQNLGNNLIFLLFVWQNEQTSVWNQYKIWQWVFVESQFYKSTVGMSITKCTTKVGVWMSIWILFSLWAINITVLSFFVKNKSSALNIKARVILKG
jgi:hypothetical protein